MEVRVSVTVRMEKREEEMTTVTVMHGCMIITMDNEQRVFRDGGIVIEGDQIKAIGQSSLILAEFASVAGEVLDLSGHILLPGSHSHLI